MIDVVPSTICLAVFVYTFSWFESGLKTLSKTYTLPERMSVSSASDGNLTHILLPTRSSASFNGRTRHTTRMLHSFAISISLSLTLALTHLSAATNPVRNFYSFTLLMLCVYLCIYCIYTFDTMKCLRAASRFSEVP